MSSGYLRCRRLRCMKTIEGHRKICEEIADIRRRSRHPAELGDETAEGMSGTFSSNSAGAQRWAEACTWLERRLAGHASLAGRHAGMQGDMQT
eukprot:3437128-Alexandrium_andersonii.AAC.1